jgi:S-disulfanyl-L-cysteine oxidoreductase SoxD
MYRATAAPAPGCQDETGHTWHHQDAVLVDIIKQGLAPSLAPQGYETDMRPFGGRLPSVKFGMSSIYVKSRWNQNIFETLVGAVRGPMSF